MADFSYIFGALDPMISEFDKYYTQRISVNNDLNVFYNQGTALHIENGNESIMLLGYAYVQKESTDSFLTNVLLDFDVSRIAEIKKSLLGQYLVILHKDGYIYMFSDFLQTRNIYYDISTKRVSSSFAALSALKGKENDNYKAFEFLSMRHCLYPIWLGNGTMANDVLRVRANEYLIIHAESGEIEVCKLKFKINNIKISSLKTLIAYTKEIFREAICHPAYKNKKVYTTITGGFDSRLVTTFVEEYYTNVNLRISSLKNSQSQDFKIASLVTEAISATLKVYETDLEKQKDIYYSLTEGLSPRENVIMTELFLSKDRGDLSFGGAFGTELYTILAYASSDDLISDYVSKARQFVKADESYYTKFELALREEFENIRSCYLLQTYDERDLMRIFQLLNTGRFSSRFVSAMHINGHQYEVFGTFPVIEAGLRIPYKYLGSKWTFGRYYLIPKYLVEQINPKIARIMTCHFCPMVPLGLSTSILYVQGKFMRKQYAKEQAKSMCTPKKLSLWTEDFSYSSNDWFEGFKLRYFGK